MDMHHCPRCELRFVNTSELRQHFAIDHGGDAGTFERYRYRSGPTSTPPATRTLLLVANQTLEEQRVIDHVVHRAADGARVLVLVPATHPVHQAAADQPGTVEEVGDASGAALARWRLGTALDRLRVAGVDADGWVGDADPFVAVTHLLAQEHVDEIVVSTLPAWSSRWLDVDLPDRLRRHTHRPVDVLTEAPIGRS